ncbi:hypothetical protein LCGC14_0391930 [marine sediment metagenome]|uniref:Uncharacterized protein n=1 Tax=marine sediment metagenome TaxID=412755 RepID=A0A0F9T4Y9_9ZZZZ
MDPKELASLDQDAAIVVDSLCPMLRSFYRRLVDEGFSRDQAFILTRDYLKGTIQGGSDDGIDNQKR